MHAGCSAACARLLHLFASPPIARHALTRSHAHTRFCTLPPLCGQGYRMRDEGYGEDWRNPDHDGGIRTAVNAWGADPAAAKARYGPIASWDVSEVTDLRGLFEVQADFNEDLSRWDVSNVENMNGIFFRATSFNGDLSSWDVSNVEDMSGMFDGATSFDHQLGGAWATSTANKYRMFQASPGTILGKTKTAVGSIQ
jgi:surface protein